MTYSLAIYGKGKNRDIVHFFTDKPVENTSSKDDPWRAPRILSPYRPLIGPSMPDLSSVKSALAYANISLAKICYVSAKKCEEDKTDTSGATHYEYVFDSERDDVATYEVAFDGPSGDDTAIYVIEPINDVAALTASIKAIQKKENDLKEKRRFAIILSDDWLAEDQVLDAKNTFLQAWKDALDSVASSSTTSAFDKLELEKQGEYEQAVKDQLTSEKRQRFVKSLKWMLYPTFWGSLIAIFVGAASLAAYLDPSFLIPLTSWAAGPVLMFAVYISAIMFAGLCIMAPIALLLSDYQDASNRVFNCRQTIDEKFEFARPDYGWLDYFADWPIRLGNWHADHKLQAGFFYAGLIGSIAVAIAILVLGVDGPFFEFIGNAIASGFHSLGFLADTPDAGAFAAHVFTATIAALTPLCLGWLGMHCTTMTEEGILPPCDKKIAKFNLQADGLTADVRFYDGLEGKVKLPVPENAIPMVVSVKPKDTDTNLDNPPGIKQLSVNDEGLLSMTTEIQGHELTFQQDKTAAFKYISVLSRDPLHLVGNDAKGYGINNEVIHRNIQYLATSRVV